MLVFRSMCASRTRCSARARNTPSSVAPDETASARAREWFPSIRISGSTMGTRPASWLSAAKRASRWALVARPVAVCRLTANTARHLVKRAPSRRYSASRSGSPSRPSVIFSPGKPGRGTVPWSTLMPGTIPRRARNFGIETPLISWRMVSSNRITPLMDRFRPGAVNSSSRSARRVSPVEGRSISRKRFSMVGKLSSAARRPLPGARSARTVASSEGKVLTLRADRLCGRPGGLQHLVVLRFLDPALDELFAFAAAVLVLVLVDGLRRLVPDGTLRGIPPDFLRQRFQQCLLCVQLRAAGQFALGLLVVGLGDVGGIGRRSRPAHMRGHVPSPASPGRCRRNFQ